MRLTKKCFSNVGLRIKDGCKAKVEISKYQGRKPKEYSRISRLSNEDICNLYQVLRPDLTTRPTNM